MLKSNRELFQAFNVLDTTWKKWSREFLPEDPEAGLRKGRTRMYTAEQAFIVWAGGQMLNTKNMTYEEAKAALSALENFLVQERYFPLKDSWREKTGLSGGPYGTGVSWTMFIHRMPGEIDNYHVFRASIKTYTQEWIFPPMTKIDVEEYFELNPLFSKKRWDVVCTVEIPIDRWIAVFGRDSGFPVLASRVHESVKMPLED